MKKILIIFALIYSFNFIYSDDILIVTAIPNLILRENPTKNSEKILSIPFSSQVSILDRNGPEEKIGNIKSKWFKIEFKDQVGWGFAGYLKTKEDFSKLLKKCKMLSGIYETVSESEWNYSLKLEPNCSYQFDYDAHYWDKKGKEINIYKKDSGLYKIDNRKITLVNSKGEIKKFTYYKLLSYAELGYKGGSSGFKWHDKDNSIISFWKYPLNNEN
jgi:hypothetical protein